jgi:hypothetical protein
VFWPSNELHTFRLLDIPDFLMTFPALIHPSLQDQNFFREKFFKIRQVLLGLGWGMDVLRPAL